MTFCEIYHSFQFVQIIFNPFNLKTQLYYHIMGIKITSIKPKFYNSISNKIFGQNAQKINTIFMQNKYFKIRIIMYNIFME